jgi:hypothetical protein
VNPSTTLEIYRPSKKKWTWVLLACVVFVVIGCAVTRSSGARDRLFALAGVLFFGVGGLVALLQFVPNSSFLQVGPDGLTIRVMWRTTFYCWSDIEGFGVASSFHRSVGLNFSTTYAGGARKLRDLLRRLTGFEGALPDTYGRDCAELAEHLNCLREEYVGSQKPTAPA